MCSPSGDRRTCFHWKCIRMDRYHLQQQGLEGSNRKYPVPTSRYLFVPRSCSTYSSLMDKPAEIQKPTIK